MTKIFDDELFISIRDHLERFVANVDDNCYTLPNAMRWFFLNCLKGKFMDQEQSEDNETERKAALTYIVFGDMSNTYKHRTISDILGKDGYLNLFVIPQAISEGGDIYFSELERIFFMTCLSGNYSDEHRIEVLDYYVKLFR